MGNPVAIERMVSFLPESRLTNEELAQRFPEWPAARILEKTGIRERRIAGADEFASDLAVGAAKRLFESGACDPQAIDVLIYCTQSPDHLLPASACSLQHRLGLKRECLAFDVNQGSSGYVVSLALAKSLLESRMGTRALVLTADVYSKFIAPKDHDVAMIFGDAATATLVSATPSDAGLRAEYGPFVFGTDGSGGGSMTLEQGGCRNLRSNVQSYLKMNGAGIFTFTMREVPQLVQAVLKASNLNLQDVDLFVFHQANRFILENLAKKIGIPLERMVIEMDSTGNTVSSTIPLALEACLQKNRIAPGQRVLLAGFGIGFSWAGTMLTWRG